MKTYQYKQLSAQEISALCTRALADDQSIKSRVADICQAVKTGGDAQLKAYSEQFDGVTLHKLYLNEAEIAALASGIEPEVKQAIDQAYHNIHTFHQAQKENFAAIDTMPGVTCWRESRAIDKVGLYVPGGSAILPSTFLMLATPAKIAGCQEIVVCTPPQKNGSTNQYVAYCAQLLGIKKIYLVGGAQAVAAMAYGTESVPAVYKIFGPGNRYVTEAKVLMQKTVAIDMPAGPSEVLVMADEHANPEFLAADLLAQAEHGADSQSILVSNSQRVIDETLKALEIQLKALPRAEVTQKAIDNSYAILVENIDQAMDFSNIYAPEHLIMNVKDAEAYLPKITNAGSVFVGELTPESAGDYASGTNHTLPTSAFANAYSGVSLDSFVKKITFQKINAQGLKNIGETVEILAEIEGLQAHKNAVTIRLNSL
jgi:histidinol dehydrogenase